MISLKPSHRVAPLKYSHAARIIAPRSTRVPLALDLASQRRSTRHNPSAMWCCGDDDAVAPRARTRYADADDADALDGRAERGNARADDASATTTTTTTESAELCALDSSYLLREHAKRSDGALVDDALMAYGHARSTSAPPRASWMMRREGDGAGRGRESKVERAKGSAEDANGGSARDLERGGGEKMMSRDEDSIGHRRAASVSLSTADVRGVNLTEIKREFARIKSSEREPRKSHRSETEDYDNSCPTCFEEYEAENPKITLRCGHHFHLACILQWQAFLAVQSRDDTCPACDAPIDFEEWF